MHSLRNQNLFLSNQTLPTDITFTVNQMQVIDQAQVKGQQCYEYVGYINCMLASMPAPVVCSGKHIE